VLKALFPGWHYWKVVESVGGESLDDILRFLGTCP
jgi:hypothetical protein